MHNIVSYGRLAVVAIICSFVCSAYGATLRATATMHWNDYARELVVRTGSPQSPRIFAYLALAQRNAAVSARKESRDIDGAVSGASAAVLKFFFPAEAQAIDAHLAREESSLGPNGPRSAFASGAELGARVAGDVIAAAKGDRFDAAVSSELPTTPSAWKSQARPPAPPILRQYPGMRPFYLSTAAEFRAPPPALDSETFKQALTRVRSTSDTRTTEQLRIAEYWEWVTGWFMPGFWNETTLQVAEANGVTQAETAEALALVHMAWIDAFIACADSKYTYWVPRPVQVDPEIRFAIALPNHPSYPSNHACTASAAGRVLDGLFPDERGRYFALAQEIALSRLYGGIHYSFDIDAGLEIGRKVSARILEKRLPTDRAWLPATR
jgi:membrane-associated phospholipid phosphatase